VGQRKVVDKLFDGVDLLRIVPSGKVCGIHEGRKPISAVQTFTGSF
jgi:hypothetical protein